MENNENIQKKRKSIVAILFKTIVYLFVAILILFIVLALLLQLPSFQNWTIKKVTNSLNKKIDGHVDIGRVNLALMDGIVLEDIYVVDNEQDTIVSSELISASFNKSLFSMYTEGIDLNDFILRNARLNLVRKVGEEDFNLIKLLKPLLGGGQKNKNKDSPLNLSLETLSLEGVDVTIIDEKNRSNQYYYIKEGYITINELDLEKYIFDLGTIELEDPIIEIVKKGTEKSITQNEVSENLTEEKHKLNIRVDAIIIKNGQLTSDQGGYSNGSLDTKDIKIEDFELLSSNVTFSQDSLFVAVVDSFKGQLNKKFRVKAASASQIEIREQKIHLSDLNFISDKTKLTNTDITIDNPNSIEQANIDADLDEIDLSLDELLYFVPRLENIEFVKQNRYKILHLDGNLKGNADNIKGDDITLSIDETTFFKGDIRGRNLSVKDNELINLNIESLSTDMVSLRDIIPGFNAPDNYNKLGAISYSGRIDGYFTDFVTYGSISTALGQADLDIRLDIKEGVTDANYSGSIALKDFNLKSWSDINDFGNISAEVDIKQGSGLTLDKADASLAGEINSFEYKGYQYKDIKLNGSLSQNKFIGNLMTSDENADIDFDGEVIFKELDAETGIMDTVPKYKFNAIVRNLDLMALNLSKKPFSIITEIDIDMDGKDLRSIDGTANNYGLTIMTNDTIYKLDSLLVSSRRLPKDQMLFKLESKMGSAELEGVFDLEKVPVTFVKIIKENYPYHTRNLGFDESLGDTDFQDFKFDIDIRDTENTLELAGVRNLRIVNTELKGYINNESDQFDVSVKSPSFIHDNYKFIDLEARAVSSGTFGSFYAYSDTTYIDSRVIKPITISTTFTGDTVDFQILTYELIDSIGKIELQGQLIPHARGYEVNLENDSWNMLGDKWIFDKKNKFVFGRDYIDIDYFEMKDSTRSIKISDVNNKGIDLQLNNFDIDLINPILDFDKMDLTGGGDLQLRIDDIFNERRVNGYFEAPSMAINGDDFGKLYASVKQTYKDTMHLNLSVYKDDQYFNLNGIYDVKRNYLDSELRINKYPLTIFEYIIPEGIENTKGTASIDLKIFGYMDDIKLDGEGILEDGGTKISYLGTTYEFGQQKIGISESYIDLTGLELKDTKGNIATMTGGLKHNNLRDLRLDVAVKSDNFIALETDEDINPLYYGHAEGAMDVKFSGGFDFADIRVKATTGPSTKMTFPIQISQTSTEESFVKFSNSASSVFQTNFTEDFVLTGLDFEMDLDITEDAEVSLIFDETVGDKLQGTGRGTAQVFIKRTGEFDVFGDYQIEQGEYLFTAYGFVAKPFELERGGIITWTGDPFDANLDIRAKYQNLRAPLNVFLEEYMVGRTELQNEASNSTDIELLLLLKGTLYNPEVNFDINIPEVIGELKSYADSKMRTLRATDNGINNQVVGLLFFRNFLPYNNPLANISGSDISATAINTVSEFFATQLSLLVTEIIEQRLTDESFIQGIDVDIGFSQNTNFLGTGIDQETGLIPDVVDLNVRNRFKNDNFVLNLGTNYVRESNLGQANYFLTDVVLEWFITDDRRLKFNIYNRGDFDEIAGARRWKTGFGLRYRTEFGTFSDFKEDIEKAIQQGGK